MLALQHDLVLHTGRPFYPADIVAELAAAPHPRVLVTTPLHLQVLLAEPVTMPSVDLVLSATAPLSVELAREAEQRFAGTLYEIYGCSEAGQIAVRRTALSQEWYCLDGIVLRQDAAGTWVSGVPIAEETLLSDVIELHDQARFSLHGRIADLVNVAGKRTSLAYLNHHLNAIEGVLDGAFVASADNGGAVSRLIAFAVAPGMGAEEIMASLRLRIDAAFLPRPLRVVELDVNAAAALMGLGISSTWKLIHSGRLPALHVGRRCLVKTEDIHRLIDSYVAKEPTRRSRTRAAGTARSSA